MGNTFVENCKYNETEALVQIEKVNRKHILDYHDYKGRTLLTLACWKGYEDLAMRILEIYIEEFDKKKLLNDNFVFANRKEILKNSLTDLSDDIEQSLLHLIWKKTESSTYGDETALTIACKSDMYRLADKLLDHNYTVEIEMTNSEMKSGLLYLLEKNPSNKTLYIPLVQKYISKISNINSTFIRPTDKTKEDEAGNIYTLMTYYLTHARCIHEEILLHFLNQKEFDVNYVGHNKLTFIMLLIQQLHGTHSEIVLNILKHPHMQNYDYTKKNMNESNLVHYACEYYDSPEFIIFLIEHIKDHDVKNIKDRTPLNVALAKQHFNAAYTLLNNGANIQQLDEESKVIVQNLLSQQKQSVEDIIIPVRNEMSANIDDKINKVIQYIESCHKEQMEKMRALEELIMKKTLL
jgi:ankyrin repeat protein